MQILTKIAISTILVIQLNGYELPELPPHPATPPVQPLDSVELGDPFQFEEVQMDFPISDGPVSPTWSSIATNLPLDAAQLREAKLGIWVHFGPQAAGESGDWYARRLYASDSSAYQNHLSRYGHPSENGYKEVLRDWNPTQLDPAELVDLYQRAGARFLLIQGVHHDQYDMWDSRYQPWNSTNMGPGRDLLEEWTSAARAADFKFGIAFHHEYSWWWWQTAFGADPSGGNRPGVPYDGNLTLADGVGKWWEGKDPRMLYGIDLREYKGVADAASSAWSPPPAGIFTNHLDYANWYAQWWALRILDVIENYDPDFIYTDGTSTQPFSGFGTGTGYKSDAMQRVIAHLMNRGIERHGENDRFAIVKFHPGDRITTTYENNYPDEIKRDQPWIGDMPVGDWFYAPGFNYNPGMVIRYLLECVSRDGAAAICIPQRPDGSLDSECRELLLSIGEWMDLNGQGIYGSRAWVQYGEGNRNLPHGKLGDYQANYSFSTEDFRYTVGADGFLYAFCMTVPSPGQVLALPALGTSDGNLAAPIESVEILGVSDPVSWEQTATELKITCPPVMAFHTSVAYKIGQTGIVRTSAPINVISSVESDSITVEWEGVGPQVSYSVKRGLAPEGPFEVMAEGLSGTSYIDPTPEDGTPYYYVISASSDGNVSRDSDYTIGLIPEDSVWSSSDVGDVGSTGSHQESEGFHLVKGSGADIWSSGDSFHFVSVPLSGNVSITAKVMSIQNTNNWAKAGVMIRESLATNSEYVTAFVSPANGVALQQRVSTGGQAFGLANTQGVNAPTWLRLSRVGTVINAHYSSDGLAWIHLGSATVSMSNEVQVGLAVCSVSYGRINHSLFSDVLTESNPDYSGLKWGEPEPVVSDSAISLNGELVHAGCFRLSGDVEVTVGDESILFEDRAVSDAFSNLANGEEAKVVSGAGGKQTNASLFDAADTEVSPEFESILDGSAWENADSGPAPGATDMILRLTGSGGAPLIAGARYQIQLFYSDDRPGNQNRSQVYHDGYGGASTPVAAGDSASIVGTFTATPDGYQDILIQNASGGANFPVALNAYVLRSLPRMAENAPIDWQSPIVIRSDNAIRTNGIEVHSGNFRSDNDDIVVEVGSTSVSFESRPADEIETELLAGEEARIIAGSGGRITETDLFDSSGTTVSSGFEAVLDGMVVGDIDTGPIPGASDMILRVAGQGGRLLQPGAVYQIQLFYSDRREENLGRTQRYHDSGHNQSEFVAAEVGTAVTGTFTVGNHGHQDIYVQSGSTDGEFPVALNAYSLRRLDDEDSDDDGLPDDWEIDHFGSLDESPDGDYDGDGTKNLAEMRLKISPVDPKAFFRATLESSGVIRWPSAQGIIFGVEASADLIGWEEVATVVGGAGTAMYPTAVPSEGSVFYRIKFDPSEG